MSTKDYKLIASVLRDHYQMHGSRNLSPYREMNRTVEEIALSFARTLKENHPPGGYEFDPIKFLDACSPDPELYPFSELWEEENEQA
jgi:hypothetical protein